MLSKLRGVTAPPYLVFLILLLTFSVVAHSDDGIVDWQAFRNGDVTLSCHFPCSLSAGRARLDQREWIKQEKWGQLAESLMKINWENQRTWYYLGLAAEGMGYSDAAIKYYKRAKETPYTCSQTLGTCDGLDFPAVADVAQARITQFLEKMSQDRQRMERRQQAESDRQRLLAAETERLTSEASGAANAEKNAVGETKPAEVSPSLSNRPTSKLPVAAVDTPAQAAGYPEAGSPEVVKLLRTGKTFELPVLINDVLTLKFQFDTGASEVMIPPDVFITLTRAETIVKTDKLPSERFTLADGSIVTSQRFRLRSMKIGSVVLHDVACSVAPTSAGALLLGQSALEKLGRYSIDTAHAELILEGAATGKRQKKHGNLR